MFKISNFQENLKNGSVSVLKMKKNSNTISVLTSVKSEDETEKDDVKKQSFKLSTTDTIVDIDLFVRILIDVSLFNWEDIDNIHDYLNGVVKSYCDKVEFFQAKSYNENYQFIRDLGNSYSGKMIVNQITIDIPYIQSDIAGVNETIKTILDEYFRICDERGISGDEKFSIAKFVAIINTIYEDDCFNGFMVANYQRINPKSTVIFSRINVPSKSYIKPMKKSHIGFNMSMVSRPDHNDPIEVIFDDRMKISEFHVLNFIKKTEDMTFPQFVCRNIFIIKKNKNETLIKNNKTSIEVGNINFIIKDNTKMIYPLESFISEFFATGCKLKMQLKFANDVVGYFKNITNRIMKFDIASVTTEIVPTDSNN